jgi:hypothetical protein
MGKFTVGVASECGFLPSVAFGIANPEVAVRRMGRTKMQDLMVSGVKIISRLGLDVGE